MSLVHATVGNEVCPNARDVTPEAEFANSACTFQTPQEWETTPGRSVIPERSLPDARECGYTSLHPHAEGPHTHLNADHGLDKALTTESNTPDAAITVLPEMSAAMTNSSDGHRSGRRPPIPGPFPKVS